MQTSKFFSSAQKKPTRSPKKKRIVALALATLGVVLAIVGARWLMEDNAAVEQVKETAETYGPEANGGVADMDSLLERYPDGRAWLTVPGASVDTPVVQASDDNPKWWLTHAIDGSYSRAGTPFIDHRCTEESKNVLVYGHHMTSLGGMFTNLWRNWDQTAFDETAMPGATWQTKTSGVLKMTALCGLEVDQSYALVQQFDWDDVESFQAWLRELVADASATNPDADAIIESSTRSVVLVTCSSALSGQPGRTLTVFVDGNVV